MTDSLGFSGLICLRGISPNQYGKVQSYQFRLHGSFEAMKMTPIAGGGESSALAEATDSASAAQQFCWNAEEILCKEADKNRRAVCAIVTSLSSQMATLDAGEDSVKQVMR